MVARVLTLLLVATTVIAAPLQDKIVVDKRAKEEIVYGNHQNSERVKKSGPLSPLAPVEQELLEQAIAKEETQLSGGADVPFPDPPVDPEKVDSKATMTVTSGKVEVPPTDIQEQSENMVDQKDELSKQVINMLTKTPEKGDDNDEEDLESLKDEYEYIPVQKDADVESLEQLRNNYFNDASENSNESEQDSNEDSVKSNDVDGSGELDSTEQSEETSDSNEDSDYWEPSLYDLRTYLKNLYDDIENEPEYLDYNNYDQYYPYKRKRRDTRKSSKSKRRVKRDLYLPEEYRRIRNLNRGSEDDSDYPGWSRETLEELINSERKESQPRYGREMEPGYLSQLEKDAEEAKDQLEILEWLYGDRHNEQPSRSSEEYDDYEDGWVEEPSYEDEGIGEQTGADYEEIVYHGQRGIFVPIKKSVPLMTSSIPFRKKNFYPYEDEPRGRWAGLVSGPQVKRNYRSAYQRVYDLAQALDSKRGLPLLEEYKKK